MSFYDRYAAIAEKRGLEPCSQKAASLFGSTKATISKWNTKDITPLGNTVAAVADALEVSTDYLLGRTDDPTDYAKGKTKPADPAPQKTVSFQRPTADSNLMQLISKLDPADRLRAEGVIQGMLMQDKYLDSLPNAAHVRTDVKVTPEMIAHDEDIMDGDDF